MTRPNVTTRKPIRYRSMPVSGFVIALGEICAQEHNETAYGALEQAARELTHTSQGQKSPRGFTPQSLTRFEIGERQPEDLGLTVAAYARAFGTSVAELLKTATDRYAAHPNRYPIPEAPKQAPAGRRVLPIERGKSQRKTRAKPKSSA
jgi:hypothetical protein